MELIGYLLIVLGAWLVGITAVVVWQFLFFKKLTRGADDHDLKKVLDAILTVQSSNTEALKSVKKEIGAIVMANRLHIQKVALVKYNPYHETGGDHSFSLVLLNEKNTGVIVTGLHARESTRIYTKEIKDGKSASEFSVEEAKALDRAMNKYGKV